MVAFPKPILFLDCDGPCADFLGGTLAAARALGHHVGRSEVTEWSFFDAWPKDVVDGLRPTWNDASWWRALPAMAPSLKDSVAELAEHYEIVVATSPWPSCPGWADARVAWVIEHLGVPERRVLIGAPKWALGDGVMVEDNAKTLAAWEARGSADPFEHDRLPVLVEMPYNARDEVRGAIRVSGLAEVADVLRARSSPRR